MRNVEGIRVLVVVVEVVVVVVAFASLGIVEEIVGCVEVVGVVSPSVDIESVVGVEVDNDGG